MRRVMRWRSRLALTALLSWATLGLSSSDTFSIHDDVLAYPQFNVLFPEEYVLESDARSRLEYAPISKHSPSDSSTSSSPSASPIFSPQIDDRSGVSKQVRLQDGRRESNNDGTGFTPDLEDGIEGYEEMVLHGQRFLCEIPRVKSANESETPSASAEEQEKELARATDRGLELLREMEGKCMYYIAGWWSYSFCYKSQVKQFHALPPGNGAPFYPPVEDPAAYAFVLGKFPEKKDEDEDLHPSNDKKTTTDVAKLQTKGDSRYLVQHLEDGTTCDITGRNRKIEVQFHCHPQTTDRIGWIKEVATCSYLMVIYTPRLCNDVAFQPPRQEQAHDISCREILTPEEVPEWEAAIAAQRNQKLVHADGEPFPVIGGIEVGAMKLVGTEGKRIEKGKVASAGEEIVEIVAKSEGGRVQRLSKEELKKHNLDPERIEFLREQLEEIARGKDWTLEVVDTNGERGLRGIVDQDEEGIEGENTEEASAERGKRKQKSKNSRKSRKAKETEETEKKDQKSKEGKKEKKDEETEDGSYERYKDEL